MFASKMSAARGLLFEQVVGGGQAGVEVIRPCQPARGQRRGDVVRVQKPGFHAEIIVESRAVVAFDTHPA